MPLKNSRTPGASTRDQQLLTLAKQVATVQANQKTMGREISEIKGQLKEIGDNVTTIVAQSPQMVTKTDCMAAQQGIKDHLEHRRELSEITGQHDIREHAAQWKRAEEKDKPAKNGVYWLKVIAAVVGLSVAFGSAIVFGVDTINRQQRTEQMIEHFVKNQQVKSPPSPAE